MLQANTIPITYVFNYHLAIKEVQLEGAAGVAGFAETGVAGLAAAGVADLASAGVADLAAAGVAGLAAAGEPDFGEVVNRLAD